MGFLEELMGEVGAASTAGAQATAAPQAGAHAAVTQAVLGMLAEQGGGGLAGLTQGFTQGGLGSLVQSWISTGPNQPATPAHIEQGMGSGMVAQIAERAGVSPQVASTALAVVLPIVVNKLTPQGQVPPQNELGSLFGGLLGGAQTGGGQVGGGLGGLLGGLLSGRK